jgi:hypothetical protein
VTLLPKPADYYVEKMRVLHVEMRDKMLHHLRAQEEELGTEDLAGVADVRGGDTIYTIDAHVDEVLHAFCETWALEDGPFVLISEGIEDAGWRVFPHGAGENEAQFLMIVDPIDGTRNIMYNKRAAWILSGIAPNKGLETTLADIQAAVMTEAPTTRALYADQLWATVGGGAHRESTNLFSGERRTLPLRPSQSDNLSHGFASIAKFFPPAKGATAAFEEKLLALVAPDEGENPLVFDDQYISTGGQLYEILVGHDRFLADLRPIFFDVLGLPKKLVCHPYDICTELIAREAGVIVTDEKGEPLSAPLDIRANVAWAGYANARLQNLIQPHLTALLEELTDKGTR